MLNQPFLVPTEAVRYTRLLTLLLPPAFLFHVMFVRLFEAKLYSFLCKNCDSLRVVFSYSTCCRIRCAVVALSFSYNLKQWL
jgi:hypothetical protein